jgi:3-keto-5-aminohexanoate cleavage enzyme
MTTPVIVEAAVNGATPKRRNPNVPRHDDEIVADALACFHAGAAIVHHHLSEAGLSGADAARAYLRIWRPVLAAHPDGLLYPTFNFGADGGHDHSHLEALAASGLARMGLCDPGSVNLGRWRDGVPGGSFVYVNDLDTVADQITTCARLGLGPAVAIYEPGFLRIVMAWHRAGRLPAGTMVKFYLCDDRGAFGGAPFGLPPTRTALDAYLEILGDSGIPWAVSVVGGDVARTDVASYALDRGGHLHLGLEFFDGDRTPTNVELVLEAAALCASHGRPLATCPQAAELLGLPTR